MKTAEVYNLIDHALTPTHDARQRRMIALIVMGIDPIDLILHREREMDVPDLEHKLSELSGGVPVQYVVGRQEFLGRDFEVNRSTLIPRPETEQLVRFVVDRHAVQRKGLRVLDIGTGSGAIAVSLALELPGSRVTAWDISTQALEVARRNARVLGASNVDFRQVDVLCPLPSELAADAPFDIIVSNPPYVTPADREQMQRNVLDYEPHSALFVPQDDPLLFYRVIRDLAVDEGLLADGGTLYFEINEAYPTQCCALLEASGMCNVDWMPDIFERPRIVWGSKK